MREIDKPSIVQLHRERCFFCGKCVGLENHHIFEGRKGQKGLSEKYGLMVTLCKEHHTGNKGVHENATQLNDLRALAQKTAMNKYEDLNTMDKWLEVFGKNYLNEQDTEEFIND